MRTDWSRATPIASSALPAEVTTYLDAHRARDVDAAIACYTKDAVVTDNGHAYRGLEEIRTWLGRSASEYTFTTELTGAGRIDETHYDVVQHLEGDFPGGVVDLHYRFTMRGPLIAALHIAP
ncbi:nuclear transport factor 2 family protein [Catellatospora sp. NPDC049111]|jgi:ketosteroid isomerase-like protein|uniref:nuclear transport factor 2 family protein n=1 Tax=unclassified Catellatospora TaxID=2645785 RepID=UPI00340B0DB4